MKIRMSTDQAVWLRRVVELYLEGTCDMLVEYASANTILDLKSCMDECKDSINFGSDIVEQLRAKNIPSS